jgi:hypothetical protein
MGYRGGYRVSFYIKAASPSVPRLPAGAPRSYATKTLEGLQRAIPT